MYIVKENVDETVTIDRKVYDELRKKACGNRTEYIPLTPAIRESVNNTIDGRLSELDKCDQTAWVSMARIANEACKNLINALPDGYPLPVTRN